MLATAAAAGCLGVVLAGLVLVACSQSPNPIGEGGACAITTDCDKGLVCVPQRNGSRICTSDLSSIDNPPTMPSDAARDGDGARDGDPDGPQDGPTSDATQQPDTGPPPGPDAGD